jgi:hypothetical protein
VNESVVFFACAVGELHFLSVVAFAVQYPNFRMDLSFGCLLLERVLGCQKGMGCTEFFLFFFFVEGGHGPPRQPPLRAPLSSSAIGLHTYVVPTTCVLYIGVVMGHDPS